MGNRQPLKGRSNLKWHPWCFVKQAEENTKQKLLTFRSPLNVDLKDDKIRLLFISFSLHISLSLHANGTEIFLLLLILNAVKNKVKIFRKCFFTYIMGLKFIISRTKHTLYSWAPEKTPWRQKLNHAISDLFCTTLNDLKYQCDLSL